MLLNPIIILLAFGSTITLASPIPDPTISLRDPQCRRYNCGRATENLVVKREPICTRWQCFKKRNAEEAVRKREPIPVPVPEAKAKSEPICTRWQCFKKRNAEEAVRKREPIPDPEAEAEPIIRAS